MSRRNNERHKQGFTLMEMLIVVAVIAVLIAVAIPFFSSSLHKSRVATDWANVRSAYAEMQADYIATGTFDKYTDYVNTDVYLTAVPLNSGEVKLKAGKCQIRSSQNGYQILYFCNEYVASLYQKHSECQLLLGGVNNIT